MLQCLCIVVAQAGCCACELLVCLQAERHALEACVLEMAGKSAALERWLADNEKKAVIGEGWNAGLVWALCWFQKP